MLDPGPETSALPHPSSPDSTEYDAVQNRFSSQVGVNFETLEAMGHILAGLTLSLNLV